MPVDTNGQTPWMSIILPTHLGGAWLEVALDSLAAQTETGFECVFIDSSPDHATVELIARYADRLPSRVFRRRDLDQWRSKTNFGFVEARASHVCMLHQDDFWLPQRAAHVRRWLHASPDI